MAQGGQYGSVYYSVYDIDYLEPTSGQTYTINFDQAGNDITLGDGMVSGNWTGNLFRGDIAEVLVYNKQLTEAQMHEMMVYLNLKYKLFEVPGDFEPDKDVDVDDLAVLAAQWLLTGDDLIADIHPSEGDGVVNLADLAEFARHWMIGVE